MKSVIVLGTIKVNINNNDNNNLTNGNGNTETFSQNTTLPLKDNKILPAYLFE